MEITIFAKKRKTQDGRIFYSFISTLPRKDGSTTTVSVKFRDDAGSPRPEDCPMNIVVEKEHANLLQRTYTREDTGEELISYTLWINKWVVGSAYVDHSLDEFDV